MTEPLFVTESGPADAPSLVLLPGGGIGNWMWREHLVDLERDFHCLAPDLPEHGQSQASGPFTMRAAAEQVAELITQRAHGGRAHVAGLSLGGQVGVALLGLAPERVDHAVLSGVLVRPIPMAHLVGSMLKWYGPLKDSDFMIWANQRSLGVPDGYAAEFAADTRRSSIEALGHIFTANMTFRVPPGLEQVSNPVLFLVGEREPGMMRGSARDLAEAMPASQTRLVSGRGHNWVLSEPALFTRALRAWIADEPLPKDLVPLAPNGQ